MPGEYSYSKFGDKNCEHLSSKNSKIFDKFDHYELKVLLVDCHIRLQKEQNYSQNQKFEKNCEKKVLKPLKPHSIFLKTFYFCLIASNVNANNIIRDLSLML